ncbi:YqcC family protein [Marinomonas sp. C2222]|uniref:YqcC family protein n=1 Tax=Marinomonas sargassi TaxID=2984494 RepID=A0ABT2YR85_9GAMM|nr:YqcC family protein [Marinomonas sargassi]MCV2402164.1 YqcC family protein [Marinomonas sargassi]
MNKVFTPHHTLADLLMDLQLAMQECEIWHCEQPSIDAMQSVEPFCIDTMSFEQWLRFVMIERFKVLIEQGMTLPNRCNIAPMAEDAFKDKPSHKVRKLAECLIKIDLHLSEL